MKTKERSVVVEVKEGGKLKRLVFPIACENGELMTHRLDRLMAGKISGGSDGVRRDTHFVGVVWKPPYSLLQELTQDRVKMQQKLVELVGHDKLTDIPPSFIPERANQTKITTLMQKELRLRRELKRRIKRYERLAEAKKSKP